MFFWPLLIGMDSVEPCQKGLLACAQTASFLSVYLKVLCELKENVKVNYNQQDSLS